MGVSWTEDQQKVIDLRDRNLLVSAAAGSGKTAVLVARILAMITDPEKPMDIDRFLIVTFTRAAAAEMRQRLISAIEKRMEEDPDNEHLQRQATLVHNAQINTIHGFCTYVIRNYFHCISLDPSWRTGEEGELKMISGEALEEVLEEAYEKREEDFVYLADAYGGARDDSALEELILRMNEYSLACEWPVEWLDFVEQVYQVQSVEELQNTRWFSEMFWEQVEKQLQAFTESIRQNLELCHVAGGPAAYAEAIESDLLQAERLLMQGREYETVRVYLDQMSWKKLSTKKGTDVDPELKDRVKKNREAQKKQLKDISAKWFGSSLEEMLSDFQKLSGPVRSLVGLTKAYQERFIQKKRQKNLIDFSDMEHLALSILVDRVDGKNIRTAAAKEISQVFDAIFIDEYQDSNDVQELLLTSISRVELGTPNIFMVGDVKQSIYSFRMAKPALFMEKYHTYSKEDNAFQRVDLKKNFRSRAGVLDSVNLLFSQLMWEDLGGICYTEDAALYTGNESYPDLEDTSTEILLLEEDGESEEHIDTKQEKEARMVGSRIRALMAGGMVTDKETQNLRPVRYSDIVILLRTVSGWGDTFYRVLQGMGIPAFRTSRTGYFSSMEVRTILDLLTVLDNPDQDIPLAGVLHSPIGGFSSEELARIRIGEKEQSFYQAFCTFEAVQEKEEETVAKRDHFLAMVREFRQELFYTPVHKLLERIYERTGYYHFVSAMSSGEQRKANLDMLLYQAEEFEKTSFTGLYHFVKYIESIQKYEVDFGEVSILGEADDVVRIMSIHKSKGLEFPIVFVSGIGKSFNQMDLRKPILLSRDMGLGAVMIDPEKRTRHPMLLHEIVKNKTKEEQLGEELRVLYVAMTRAKEKLILTGTAANLEKKLGKESLRVKTETVLPFEVRSDAKSYLDWILSGMMRRPEFLPVLEAVGVEAPERRLNELPDTFSVRLITENELYADEILTQLKEEWEKEAYLERDPASGTDPALFAQLEEIFSWTYPYEGKRDLPAKVTVSEIKKQSMHDEEALPVSPMEEEESFFVPAFMRPQIAEEIKGAARGTVYHLVMELLSFKENSTRESIAAELDRMEEEGYLTRETRQVVDAEDIFRMVDSKLGRRMVRANEMGLLYREQPFMIRENAKVLKPEYDGEEILVQGIIDAYFEEEDQLILMDYKTDYCPGDGRMLVDRYHAQLTQYAKALERLTGKTVAEMWIYSFYRNEMIAVPKR